MDPLRSTTQRVVFLIDLDPLFSSQNPGSYLTPILSSTRRILSSPQLANSLSALKFFFSSLSPISSSSRTHRLLGKCPNSLSFNHHSHTLIALSQTLELISSTPDLDNSRIDGGSKASLLAKSLLQLENEYVWEAKRNGETEQGFLSFGSNLIILFSPVLWDAKLLAQFVDLEDTGDGPVCFDDFAEKFFQFFDPVKERLDSQDITLSWVDVDFEVGSDKPMIGSNWVERALKERNWGFSSTDAIVMGSYIIPVGLIFPFICCSIGHVKERNCEAAPMELILEISDVNGKPLDCKSCEFEALHLQTIDQRSVKMSPSFKNFGREITKVRVEGVRQFEDTEKVLKNALSVVLIHGFSSKAGEIIQNGAEEFFADKILEQFCAEREELVREMPIWQLFLSFLYSRSYSALVSVPYCKGTFFEGVLIPFTINHGLLYVLETGFLEKERCRCYLSDIKGEKRKRKQATEKLLESQNFLSFRDIAISCSEVSVLGDICDLYFRKFSSKLKKLKFFKCWVSQMRESCTGRCNLMLEERESKVEAENQSQQAPFENKMDINEEGVSPFSSVEEAESFLGSLEEKIEKNLLQEDGSLGISVESFIHLMLDAVSKRVGGEGGVGMEVAKLILKKPKDLLAKYKDGIYNATYKLREPEVQILFRMEILNSMVGSQIEESRKQRMIREICMLLQFIDLNLQNNSSAVTSILDVAERTIKSRYTHSVPDIVQQIYSQMEFDMSEQDGEFCSANSTDPDNISEPKIEKLSIHEKLDEMLEKKKLEARERIDRQRRFKSFTSWMPDLHRVWALKQPKFERNVSNLRPPNLSRRKRRRVSSNFVVCETPMTGVTGSTSDIRTGNFAVSETPMTGAGHSKEATSDVRTPNRSLSKALFHDEIDAVRASPSTDPTCQ